MHRNGWSVSSTFELDEIVQILPNYNGLSKVKVIPIDKFFNRVFQLGLSNVTQLEAACIGHLLGKPELDFPIVLSELKMILEGLGVQENYDDIKQDLFSPEFNIKHEVN